MGVAGSGKSTVGPRLAEALGVDFVDGDDEHTDAARAQMAADVPLSDEQRGPWLDRLHEVLLNHADDGIVLACSALKRSYRHHLVGGLENVLFVALVAPPEQLEARLKARPGHFAGPQLLASQLHALELDDDIAVVDSTQPVDAVTAAARRVVETGGHDRSA
jgi:gluconokinase